MYITYSPGFIVLQCPRLLSCWAWCLYTPARSHQQRGLRRFERRDISPGCLRFRELRLSQMRLTGW